MVNPIHLISIPLGVAFLLGLFGKGRERAAYALFLLSLLATTTISVLGFVEFLSRPETSIQVFTAGYRPPISISLQMGLQESFGILLINAVGLLGGWYLRSSFLSGGKGLPAVFLVWFMSLNVIVLTDDIFNLFVFLEIAGIATAGLILLSQEGRALAAGFKYMMATGIIATLFLLGVIFIYSHTGSLYIKDIVAARLWLSTGGSVALILVIVSMILELKPFPANGWALDVYQSAHPGIGALISAGSATALLFVLHKLLPVGGPMFQTAVLTAGGITFLGSAIPALRQTDSRRLLGYSSVGQIGLLMMVLGLKSQLGDAFTTVFSALLLGHYLAKAGLFWLAGQLKDSRLEAFSFFGASPLRLFLFATFLLALTGMPPFPSFFGKWELLKTLWTSGQTFWIGIILLGTLLESVYLFRWFGKAYRGDHTLTGLPVGGFSMQFPPILFGLALYATGYFWSQFIPAGLVLNWLPLFLAALLFLLDFLPARLKNLLLLAGIAGLLYLFFPKVEGDILRLIFAAIFGIGSILTLIPGFSFRGRREGLYPLLALLTGGLLGIVTAETGLQFFFSWEMMTLSSYFLIMRGKDSEKAGLRYILFSAAGALLLLAGLSMVAAESGVPWLAALQMTSGNLLAFLLILGGMLIKVAAAGLHIWLPGAYTHAEDDITPLLSGVMINSGVFGLFLLLSFSDGFSMPVMTALGWLGAITALTGNMVAVFQEDVKKLVAYSSIGAMGYILFALSMMSHLGWLTALTYGVNHFLYKSLIFLAVAGVLYRVKSRKMYEMGGLIKRMPWSFIGVLIGIITLAGIPPLSGFAGKWLFYNAVITKGWYLQGTLVFFSGIVAFLYCFKLISSVFLGQQKDHLRKVKEAPAAFIIPQLILIGLIMVFSLKPRLLLQPLGERLAEWFPSGQLVWQGDLALSSLGYWNASQIGMIVMAMFGLLFLWLWFNSRKAQKVKQFDITFSGEKPFRPETSHVSYNMFAAYNKSLGFLVAPFTTSFWRSVAKGSEAVAENVRRFYTGNGQAYALHIVLYVTVFFMLMTDIL